MSDSEQHKTPQELATEDFLSGDKNRICKSLVGAAFYEPDWRWVQNKCLDFLSHEDDEIRGLAATCLGHLARIHGVIDEQRVVPAIKALLNDPACAGQADDALCDIRQFVTKKRRKRGKKR